MKHSLMIKSLLAGAALVAANAAAGQAVVPTFGEFKALPGATYAGSGIPTDPTAIRTITDGANTITLGLTAFGRYANPPLANNGAGVFTAGIGVNDGLQAVPHALGTTWGFGYYISIAGGGTFADYNFRLLYDLDPAAGTVEPAMGSLDLNAAIAALFTPAALGVTTKVEDAQNLYFGFFATNAGPVIDAPDYTTFDPYAVGEYGLALVARETGQTAELGRTAILVRTVPDAGATAVLLFGSVLALAAMRRRN